MQLGFFVGRISAFTSSLRLLRKSRWASADHRVPAATIQPIGLPAELPAQQLDNHPRRITHGAAVDRCGEDHRVSVRATPLSQPDENRVAVEPEILPRVNGAGIGPRLFDGGVGSANAYVEALFHVPECVLQDPVRTGLLQPG